MTEYAIGHGGRAVDLMNARPAEDWAAHVLPHLRPSMRLREHGRLLREAGFGRVALSSSYNWSGHGFEKAAFGEQFGGMVLKMKSSIMDTGRAAEGRVEAIADARRLGTHEDDFFAPAAGEAIGWKPAN